MDCVPPISAAEDERGFMQDGIHRKWRRHFEVGFCKFKSVPMNDYITK
jgi:hypothetical protein